MEARMEEIRFVDRKQVHWPEIKEILKAEGIAFTIHRNNDRMGQVSSGMGRIERLKYCFLLSYDGSAMLMIQAPRHTRKIVAIERLVSLISEYEEANLTRFPLFRNMVPAIDVAMKLLPHTREQLPRPRPNLKYRVDEIYTLSYEWGCRNCSERIELLRNHFKGVQEYAI